MTKVLFVANVGWFFMSHRLPLARAARDAGYEVHIALSLDPVLDEGTAAKLAANGFTLHPLNFSRSGASPFELLTDFFDLLRLFRRTRPDIVHLITLKPILLGGPAARLSGVPASILAIPGRGSVFSARGLLSALRRWVAVLLYRASYRRARDRVVVQNVEDRDYFVARGTFDRADIRLIRGSGVNLADFAPQDEPPGDPVVTFASRMLKEKGAEDFVAAAHRLRQLGVRARFVLVGDPDPGNPHSHSREELETWAASGAVEWLGFRSDMNTVFESSHIVCLPTFYGEGVPKVLIEAAACGRPIVTTDIAGCRDIVRHEENGLLVEARNVAALVAALERLLRNPELRRAMGVRGRALVEREFGIELVVRQTLSIYGEVL